MLAAAVIAGAAVYWRLSVQPAAQAPAAVAAVRTAAVTAGTVDTTIRLTGTTAAEKFASLIAPQLRGSRSGRGRSDGGGGGGSSPTATVTSNAGRVGSSSSSAASGGNMSSAMRSSTSRFGGGGRSSGGGSAGASSGGNSAGAAAAAAAATGGASAATGGGGGGGGGMAGGGGAGGGGGGGGFGGGGDFGLVLQKAAKPGSMVKKGESVAEFDRQFQLLRLDDYRASVTLAEAALTKLKADLEVTRKNHEQSIAQAKATLDKARLDMKTLPVLSEMDATRIKLAVEQAEAQYKQVQSERRLMTISLNSQIRNSEIELSQAKLELKRAEANVDRMVLKAPIDGLAVMQIIPRGSDLAQVQEGDQLFPGMMFMTIVDPSSMVINAVVNQVDVERLRMGAKARVRFDAYPDLVLPAHVVSVGGIPRTGGQRANYVKEIPIRLKLDAMDPRVIPDLSVNVGVIVESETEQASIVPLGAIFEDTPGQPYVFVKEGAAWVRRSVELGLSNYILTSVRSGLKPNEVVALERPPAKSKENSQ